MGESVLKADGITKVFPGVRALDDVTLEVSKGEVLGLIGENGAGKSTILKVINGIYPSGTYEGTVYLNGGAVSFKSPHDALAGGIGFVPQEINVMDDLSVVENIFVGHIKDDEHKRVKLTELYKRAEEFLEENKLELDPKMRVRMLSIGQKQLLMIARALSWQPDVLILDEPTTALSQDDVAKLFEIVDLLKKRGIAIVFVTHKLEEIFELTDRVTVLRDGKLIDTFAKSEYDRDTIISAMVGRKITNLYPERECEIGDELLRVEGLTVNHPKIADKLLIDDVSFSVRRGEVIGLAGLVGAGRTETVSTIFGQYRLKAGKIFIDGKEVRIKNEADAIKNGIAYVTEDRKSGGLLMLSDIKDNIALGNLKSLLNGILISNSRKKQCASDYMQSMRIKAPSIYSMVANLSGGNQQKVVLAKALNSHPRIMILDEPTKGIDVGSKNEIYNMINELASSGIAVIIVSSELPELLGMCDRFIVMSHGKKVGELDKAEATQESIMRLCFM